MADINWAEPKKGSTALEIVRRLDLTGRYFLVTGANQGIGFEVTKALASAGANVTMACRNVAAAQIAQNNLLEFKNDAKITVQKLDLADLGSVESCASDYISSGRPLHGLILNAGIYCPDSRTTADGLETTFQVNHLSQFYLTRLLTDTLIKSSPSRVVVVSSCAQVLVRQLPIEQFTAQYVSPPSPSNYHKPMYTYGLTKLCNTLFAQELHKRHCDKGVVAFSCHPGVISSSLSRNSSLMYWGVLSIYPFTSTLETGAGSVVHCALSPTIVADGHGGKYFTQCRLASGIITSPVAYDTQLAENLWNISEETIHEWKSGREKAKH